MEYTIIIPLLILILIIFDIFVWKRAQEFVSSVIWLCLPTTNCLIRGDAVEVSSDISMMFNIYIRSPTKNLGW